MKSEALRIFGTADDSIVDGPGIRFAVFTQGCSQNCPGCHNPKSHAYDGGVEISAEELWGRICTNPILQGLTLSGGEPFDQAAALLPLARWAHAGGAEGLPSHKPMNVWAYSGYLFEDLIATQVGQRPPRAPQGFKTEAAWELLQNVDVLVDGRFEQDKKSYALVFRGSSNQRLIDVPASLRADSVVEWEQG
jgi:anaerobic ribonucleoside-triphosphate reductase activating protein